VTTPSNEGPRPLRAVYVVSLFPCWSETFIVREVMALLRRGVDVRIVSLKRPFETLVQPDAASLLARVLYPPTGGQGITTVVRQVLRDPGLQVRLLARLCRGLAAAPLVLGKTLVTWWRTLAILPRIAEQRPDVLHAHWASYPSTAAWIAAHTLGTPFSFTSHAHDIFVEDQLLSEKLSGAEFAVTISEFNRKRLQRRFGLEAVRRLHVVHCGVSPSELVYRRQNRETSYVLSVARLESIKGLEYLVAACESLQRRGVLVRCDIVGEGRCRRQLEGEIARRGLKNMVRLVGAKPQQRVRELLYEASVFVLPSIVSESGDSDGIPVVLMEAMAAGVPVVSTTVSGIPELVKDGVSGLLVAPRDGKGLADAIQRLLTDAELRSRLAVAARKTVEEHFDVDAETETLLGLFRKAAGRKRPW
jgi:colanic acid/amylovoran biosynthesis glycosyltransferase